MKIKNLLLLLLPSLIYYSRIWYDLCMSCWLLCLMKFQVFNIAHYLKFLWSSPGRILAARSLGKAISAPFSNSLFILWLWICVMVDWSIATGAWSLYCTKSFTTNCPVGLLTKGDRPVRELNINFKHVFFELLWINNYTRALLPT